MRVPLLWLREYCDPPLDTAGIVERLDLTGTEVERVERVGVASSEAFVVGKVLGVEQHPDADRLRVCRVDDGNGSRTIVCGAPNVAAGQTVAVALPGAVMPDGSRLGEAKLRGVTSSGMILAEDEVGLGPDHGGIMVLPDGLPAGAPLDEHLPISEEALELEITPNRPDCLAVYGVARELHAATGVALAGHPAAQDAAASGDDHADAHASVEVRDSEICLRFTARVFEGVRVGTSPLWLRARLAAAGQRPISNVVDITNYVMLLTGQPLHAFDLDRVPDGRVIVRRAQDGERMTTLDGIDRVFDRSMALVCDENGPSGIAGIMGGQVSEVSDSTTRVLMEAATWVGTNVLQTSSRLALRTEASGRFEKQLHPDSAIEGQRLAARLMVELCGARLVPGTIDAYPAARTPARITLRPVRVERLLGERIPAERIGDLLGRLGFAAEPEGDDLCVVVPHFREMDVEREADLIEEVARLHGLEHLPVTLPARKGAVGRLARDQRVRRRIEDTLRDRGLDEIVAWSFTSPEALERLGIDGPPLRVANPLSEDQSEMRPLLLPGLLDAVAHNAARGRAGLALFESAHVYRPGGDQASDVTAWGPQGARAADERHHVGGLITEAATGGWRSSPEPADFYTAKGLVEAVMGAVGVPFSAEPAPRPFLHPGRAAEVVVGGESAGWIGELHPATAQAWDIDRRVAAFELDAGVLAERAEDTPLFRDLVSYPAVLQDIAVVVAEERSAAEVEGAVRRGGGELLESASVFDVYRGEQAGEGNKSLALRLEFRAADRTLTDADVAEPRARIERELESVGGRLRA